MPVRELVTLRLKLKTFGCINHTGKMVSISPPPCHPNQLLGVFCWESKELCKVVVFMSGSGVFQHDSDRYLVCSHHCDSKSY